MARIFVGVAWPYANSLVNIGGFAGVYLPADAFARYHRLKGDEVLMVSGSDVHGTPVLVAAEKEGSTPEAVARRYATENAAAFRGLGISFDLFTDTHTLVHQRTVQELFLALLENGYIGRKTEENPYCPKHQRFLPDRYVEGECPHCHSPTARGDECDRCGRILEPKQLGHPRCRLCQTPAEFRASEHFYLQLDKLEPKLRAYLADKDHWRANVTGVTRNFLQEGLHPTPITRDLEWGVPIPLEGYDAKRFYVWFDAVIGYLSATREWAVRSGHPEAWLRFWDPQAPVRAYYFLGKDNIFFHTVVWPSILLGHGRLQLPYDVDANEWLQLGGLKISKSGGVDPELLLPNLLQKYSADVIRFYAAQLAPQNHDTEFRWDEFHQVTGDVLSNQYGNLVQRILVLVRDKCAGAVPRPPEGWSAEGPGGIAERLRSAHDAIGKEFEAVRLKEALERALLEIREENRRVHEAKPWQASPAERDRALFEGLWLLKAAAVWLAPFLPTSSAQVYRLLGFPAGPEDGQWDDALVPPVPGQKIGEVLPLFPRREAPDRPPAAPAAVAVAGSAAAPPALDIRAGVVRAAENHPSADRLYVLQVDVGEPTLRTIVAGIRPFYPLEELVGRPIVVLANLEPRTIRKMTSQGMVLAADDGERAVLLSPPAGAAPGSPLLGARPAASSVTYAQFELTPLVVGKVTGPAPTGTQVDLGARTVAVDAPIAPGTVVVVQLDAPEALHGGVLATPEGGTAAPGAPLPPGTRVR
jgi:methionyl-tRNA synthetase